MVEGERERLHERKCLRNKRYTYVIVDAIQAELMLADFPRPGIVLLFVVLAELRNRYSSSSAFSRTYGIIFSRSFLSRHVTVALPGCI